MVSTICAFSLITSARVRIAQETSSAAEEAAARRMRRGMRPLGDEEVTRLMWVRSDLFRLYVVKNAHDGNVAIMALPTP